jgi:hypothetical protein
VVAQHAGVNLHHQAVLARHLSHLVEHVCGKRVDFGLTRLRPAKDAAVQFTGCIHLHWGGVGQQVAVISGAGAGFDKCRPARTECLEKAAVA